ncbi:hypothetical protein [Vibrio sagamiensis]|uniref:Uncharacterized protein n=1 Tax=Vibrio sagamiensis NBRC 104589 TaxID=1219064 RepID=A0A511QIR8_9VIBR|nr:hypothetical protein [Vibrio sagamiensis]PNQ69020.1 hypothetical protein C1141_06445 [Vibrio agarivorans]GEM77191.1 hypothetical protein VSA01S_33030 [Vibrio sagamiensis NBRC 104589]
MSIEQKITELQKTSAEQTAASHGLSQEVAGKMGEIDQRVKVGIENIERHFTNIDGMSFKRIRISWSYPPSGSGGTYAVNAEEGSRSAAILLFPNDTGNLTALKHVSGSIILSRGGTGNNGYVGFGDFIAHRGYAHFTGVMNNSFGSFEPFITNKFIHEDKEWVALILKPRSTGGGPTDGIWFDVKYRFHHPKDGEQMFKIINPVDERLYNDVFSSST